jgi:eukaryotic-like serine/threonine-protein kinase
MFPRQFGKYLLERELSRGGMATVFLATLKGAGGFEKKLVVKQIRDELSGDPAFIDRFVREAKTAVQLNHPNIVPVFELGAEQGVYFIAMELVRGLSLAELIHSAQRSEQHGFSPAQGAHIGAEICKALDYAHRTAHVIHRDITPRNVMLDEEGQIKLIDFGIAHKALSLGEGIFGSPGHMPPEQMRGDPLDQRADLFAVAALLMEVWSGQPPFRRTTPPECEAAMNEPHPKPSEIDPSLGELDAIIGSAMSLEQLARPESANVMARAFRQFVRVHDTTELARELGARVRAAYTLRESMRPPPGFSESEERGGSVRKMITRTFAERALDAEALGAPSTRKMAVEPDVPAAETKAAPPVETHRGSVKNARSLWPGVLAVAGLGAVAFRFAGSMPTVNPPVLASERTASTLLAPAVPSTVLSAATPSSPTAGVAAAAPVSLVASSGNTAPHTATSHKPAPSSAASTTPTATGAASSARITLLCGANTLVLVDNVARGKCPARDLEIKSGSHEIRFVFEPTGESLGERVSLEAGEQATVRADFTTASPQIRVSRHAGN